MHPVAIKDWVDPQKINPDNVVVDPQPANWARHFKKRIEPSRTECFAFAFEPSPHNCSLDTSSQERRLGWRGLVWLGLAWLDLTWIGLVWLGLVWSALASHGFGLGWLGLDWFGWG